MSDDEKSFYLDQDDLGLNQLNITTIYTRIIYDIYFESNQTSLIIKLKVVPVVVSVVWVVGVVVVPSVVVTVVSVVVVPLVVLGTVCRK